MKKILLTVAALFTLNNAIAQKLDLKGYKESCIKSYEHSIYRNGTSDLNGVYLKYKGRENINPFFSSLYFSPDYNLNVMFNESYMNKKATYDLNKEDDVFTFYDHKEKSDGDRSGMKFEIEHSSYNTYVLKAYITTYNKLGSGLKYIPIYDKKFDFSVNKKDLEPIYELTFERDLDKEDVLYSENTELSLACRK